MNLNHLFDLSLIGRRDTVALEFDGREFTFGEIDARSNRLAHLLTHRGLKTGDRLCVYLANCVEMIDLYLACVKLGVIFVPINILYRDREIAHILQRRRSRAVVAAEPFASPVPRLDPRRTHRTKPPPCPPHRPAIPLDGDTPAGIIYTSGTTGASKGAVLTHNNFAANAITLLACWQITAADRFLLALPLFHVHALGNGLHCWLASGCRMRLLERFEHSEGRRRRSSTFAPPFSSACPPSTCASSISPPKPRAKSAPPCASSSPVPRPCPPQVLEEFRARFGHTILERYGMSENLMNISNPYLGERRPGSVGLPLPGVSVRLVDGEIQLKGPNLFAGYWRREEATRAAFVDGWFRTGDLAECAPDGYYTLSGRKSDLIISGGFNIYPREIEEFLQEQQEVAEAAVVGIADPVRGEVPVAYIVCRCAIDPADLAARCREKLASFKVPRAFHTVDSLPRNAMGKIQKHLLPPVRGGTDHRF